MVPGPGFFEADACEPMGLPVGVRIVGVNVDAIERGEDRLAFKDTMNRLGIDMPKSEIVHTVDEAEKVAETYGKKNAAPFYDLVRAFKIKDVAEREGKPLEAEVQVIALGDEVAWVGLPGEIFAELGMMIKVASPFRFTSVSGLTNGSVGYVPNRKAYPEGAYEVVSARCGPSSGALLVDAATRLLVEAHTEAHAR